MTRFQPACDTERIAVVDILRGFALFGVFVINIYFFNKPPFGFIDTYTPLNLTDTLFFCFIKAFIAGKFILLFSFLFGTGLILQITRLQNRNSSYKIIYLRRLLFLSLFGIIHSVFIWEGDILFSYSVFGLILFIIHRVKPAVLPILAVLITGYLFYTNISRYMDYKDLRNNPPTENREEIAEKRQKFREEMKKRKEAFTKGSYIEILNERISMFFSFRRLRTLQGEFLNIFPFFLFGAWAARKRVFTEIRNRSKFWKRILCFSLPAGVLAQASVLVAEKTLFFSDDRILNRIIAQCADNINGQTLCVAYIALLVLIYQVPAGQKLLKHLSYIGRTAFSSYIGQSVAFSLIFCPYALKLAGEESISVLFLGACILFTVQIAISKFWLSRFRFGPLEWIWRSFTYIQRLTIKKS